MLLIPGQVHQAMGFQGTVFRPMRSAKGIGRDSSSAEKFDERQILIGGRLRAGMTGQRTAAGRSFGFGKLLGINAQKGAHVTILSPAFSSLPKNFRQTAGCRPVSRPVAGAKRGSGAQRRKTTTTALVFAVASPAVTGHHGRACGGSAHLNLKKKMKNRCFLSFIVSVAAATSLNATVVLNENFNPPAYSTGDLVGQNGWAQVGTTTANPIQVNGGKVLMNQGSSQDASHGFDSAITSGSIFYLVTINFSSKNGTADYAVHLSDGGTNNFGARLYAQSSGGGFHLGWAGSSTAPTTWGADLSFDTTYTVVFQYNIVAGAANDTGALYVTSSAFDPVQANNTAYQTVTTWTGGTELSTFAAANLRQGSNSGALTVGNFVVGTTWADVVPVPEPSSVGLLIGGVGMMFWNFRRKRVS
jgi:hypothetical protein